MTNNYHSTSIPNVSLNSSNIRFTIERPLLSSTTYQIEKPKVRFNNVRRKEIIPTPNRPRKSNSSYSTNVETDIRFIQAQPLTMNQDKIIDNEHLLEMDENNKVPNLRSKDNDNQKEIDAEHTMIPSSQQLNRNVDVDTDAAKGRQDISKTNAGAHPEKTDDEDGVESENNDDQKVENENFDGFILRNFPRFSGSQNIFEWLDEVENKFNYFEINRELRFTAIPLLVEGNAKRKYIINRKIIHSFDDFYEFLLMQFQDLTCIDHCTYNKREVAKVVSEPTIINQDLNMNTVHEPVSHRLDTINNANRSNNITSETMINHDTTDAIGDVSVNKNVMTSSDVRVSMLDDTLTDLRRAIVDNLIKNPKIFRGAKDNVQQWIEELEHLFELARIPDMTRLDFVSYSLRGDALEWFRNHRSSFSSWQTFVRELKRAFTSSFQAEIAFKQLETYSQGANQSICNFFNEVLKLCKETDSSMSETTKLKHLLNKTKPSIQFEVRKRKPISTTEFLEYAKEAEELIQLSNLTISHTENKDDSNNNYSDTSFPKQTIAFSKTSTSTTHNNPHFHNKPTTYRNSYSDNYNNRRGLFNSQHGNPYPYNTSSLYARQPYNKPYFKPHNQSSSYAKVNRVMDQNHPQTQNASSYEANNKYNTVNAINQEEKKSNVPPLLDSSPLVNCHHCQQIGHDTSSCQNF